jgi:hypothetical protein
MTQATPLEDLRHDTETDGRHDTTGPPTIKRVTGKSGRGTARQTVRIPEDEWVEFGKACEAAGTDRSEYLREVLRWAIGRPRARAPRKLAPVPPPAVAEPGADAATAEG